MKIHVENSKKFELDKLLIKQIYNIKEKKKPEYKVIKKNVVYDKQLTKQYFNYLDINKSNYYGNYQSFREYLSSGYNSEFLINEINNIKSIIGYSENLRHIVERKLNPDLKVSKSKMPPVIQTPDFLEGSNQDLILTNSQQSQKINNNLYKKSGSFRRPSTVFQVDKENPLVKRMADLAHKNVQIGQNLSNKNNKFIEMCHLLKLKEEESKNPQNQYQFRLYSKLSEEFDPFFLPVYESFMNVKYENQKSNLIKIYNNEKAFVNCVISIKERLKSHINIASNYQNPQSGPESLNSNIKMLNPNLKQGFDGFDVSFQNIPQLKFQMKIPYINAFYFGRTDVYFKDIDNFMSMYKENISLASKRLEKDFFENLYKILTFNNTDCKRFLQYLYSNSYFFKYIYNIFTLNKKSDDSLKNVAPLIKRHNDEEPFLNESMKESFFLEAKEKTEDENKLLLINQSREENKEKEEEKANNEDNDFFNSLIGNEFIYKIDIIPEDVSDYVNKKRIHKFKKIITNKDKFEDNYIITLNNNENMLEIYDLEKKENLFSFPFDSNVCFYDLEKDLKNNIKSEKIIKNEKYILIGQKTNFKTFNNTYISKLPKDIYTRFAKSISTKGNKIKKTELFSSEENKKDEKEGKLNLEDMLSLRGEEEKNQSDKEKELNLDNDSDKHSSTKNEKNIKFDNRNFSRSMTFRKSSADKSNSGNEKSDNEEKDQIQKNDSSIEVKEKEGKDEESEEDENEDEMKEESDGEESENDKKSNEDNNMNNVKNSFGKQDSNDNNPINKNKKKEKSDDDENSFKDNINNKFSEENDNNKSDGSGSGKNVNKKINNPKNLEEINTDLDNNIFKNNPTIESKSKSSENEE